MPLDLQICLYEIPLNLKRSQKALSQRNFVILIGFSKTLLKKIIIAKSIKCVSKVPQCLNDLLCLASLSFVVVVVDYRGPQTL